MTQTPVYFYIAPDQWPTGNLPTNAGQYLQWFLDSDRQHQWLGKYDWTLQTYLHLKDAGYACELVSAVPQEGIVLSHRDFLSDDLSFSERTLLVCLISDKERPGSKGRYQKAKLNIVQNRAKVEYDSSGNLFGHFIRHWPQAGLIARDKKRGTKFENIRFFGEPVNLLPQLRSEEWKTWLGKNFGFDWQIVPRDKWYDYSDTDAVVAIRSFDDDSHPWKPPTKLFNSWLAGVPAILGHESAYIAERKSNLDYLEVKSIEELVYWLQRLRADIRLRTAMQANGATRSAEISTQSITNEWIDFLDNVAKPLFAQSTPIVKGVQTQPTADSRR